MVAINAVGGSSAIGGPLAGATPGSVLFADEQGYLGQDNANLYWDNINKRLGIGTSAPATALDLFDGSVVNLRLTPTESDTFLDLRGAGLVYQMRRYPGLLSVQHYTNGPYNITLSPGGTGVGISTLSPAAALDVDINAAAKTGLIVRAAVGQSENLQQWRNSSDSVLACIDEFGRLGIGNDSPTRHIDVNTGANEDVIVRVNAAVSGNQARLDLDAGNAGHPQIRLRENGADKAYVMYHAGDDVFKINADASWTSNHFTIDASGNIGMGTNSPATPLGFQNTLHIKGDYGALVLETTTGGDHQFLVGANSSGGRQFLDFFDVPSAKRIMTLGADQLIGINEWYPDAMLEIASKDATTTALHVQGAPAQSANYLEVTNSSGTGVLVVSPSERVSIGNASLSSVLNIGGDQVARFNTGGTWQNMDALSTSSSGGANFVMTCADFRLGTDLACKLNIVPRNTFQPALGIKQATGGIGKLISIRDSAGMEKMGLTIEGCTKEGAGSGLARFQFDHTVSPASADGDGVGFSLRTENASGGMVDIAYIDAVYDDISDDDVSLRISTRNSGAPTERIRISPAGYVGINETVPDSMLEVASDVAATTTLHLTAAAGQSADLVTLTNSSDSILAKFDATGTLQLRQASGGNMLEFFSTTNSDTEWITYVAGEDLRFRDTTDRVTLAKGGNIGVGITNPQDAASGAFGPGSRTIHIRTTGTNGGLLLGAAPNSGNGGIVEGRVQRAAVNVTNESLLRLYGGDQDGNIGAAIFLSADGQWGASDYPGNITFHTVEDGTDTLNERMRIDEAGKVGINEAAPDAMLQVNASNATTTALHLKAAASQSADLQEWQDNSGTAGARVNRFTEFSNPYGTTTSEFFGGGAGRVAAGDENVGVGNSALLALTTGIRNTAVGFRSLSFLNTSANNVAVGNDAGRFCTGGNNVFLGAFSGDESGMSGSNLTLVGQNTGTLNNPAASIAIGSGATITGNAQFVAGSSSCPATDVYFGQGVANAAPTNFTIHGTGGSGTDIAGGDVTIAGGQGTGTGIGGNIVFQYAAAGSTGNSLNSLATAMTIDGDTGNVQLFNGTAPTASVANGVILYAKDEAASSELFALDEAGNETKLSPHNEATGEWVFYSKNQKTGKVLHVDMERLMKDLNHHLGGGYVREWYEHELN